MGEVTAQPATSADIAGVKKPFLVFITALNTSVCSAHAFVRPQLDAFVGGVILFQTLKLNLGGRTAHHLRTRLLSFDDDYTATQSLTEFIG